jgi:hypothetical protein
MWPYEGISFFPAIFVITCSWFLKRNTRVPAFQIKYYLYALVKQNTSSSNYKRAKYTIGPNSCNVMCISVLILAKWGVVVLLKLAIMCKTCPKQPR